MIISRISTSVYHWHAVRAEFYVQFWVKVVYRLYQSYYAYLKEVVKLLAAVAESVDHAQNQPQIALYHLVARTLSRLFVTAADNLHKLSLAFLA